MASRPDRPGDLDRLARDMIAALDGIMQHLMRAVISEGMEDISLTFQEIRVFKTVSAEEPITMNALAGFMRISLPTATRLVEGLVAKGVLVRTRTAEDRRLVLVSRSEMAKAREQVFFSDRAAMIRGTLKQLAPAEREKMAGTLKQIAQVLQFNPSVKPGQAQQQKTAIAKKRGAGRENRDAKGSRRRPRR